MSQVVADLVARISAQGVQETTAQIKGVGAEAKQTAAALELMASQFSKQFGGSATQALEMFHRTGVQPTAAAFSEVAKAAEKSAAAVQATVAPTQAAARAATDLHQGFSLSGSSILRTVGAIAGVNLGLSAAAGLARKFHEELAAGVDAEHRVELASRSVAASYGGGASAGFGAAAATFAADPSTRGTQSQYLEAAAGMQSLTTAYGLNNQQVQQLVQASGQLARIHGVELPTAAKALEAVMRGNTSAAEGLGVALTDQVGRLRGVNATYEELVTISGKTRAEQILLGQTLANVKTQQDNARGSSDDLAAPFDRLGKSYERNRQLLGSQLKSPATGAINAVEMLLNPPGMTAAEQAQRRAGIIGVDSGGRGQTDTGEFLSAAETQHRIQQLQAEDTQLAARAADDARAAWINFTPAIQQNTAAAQTSLTTYEQLRVQINHTVETLGRIGQQQGQFATIGQALAGTDFPLALRPGQAARMGGAAAAQDVMAQRAQRVAEGSAISMRAQLEAGLREAQNVGPNAIARAQSDLSNFDQRSAARSQQVEAEHAAGRASLSIAQAQAGLTAVDIRQRERATDLAERALGLRRQDLQAQQTVLQLSEQTTRAQITALPSGNALQDLDYRGQRIRLQAEARMARLLRGQDTSDLPTIDELITQNMTNQLDRPETALRALDATRGVDLAQRAERGASLTQGLAAAPLAQEGIALQLENLKDLPEQTKSLRDLYQGQTAQLEAERGSREALVKLADLAEKSPSGGASGVTVPVNITINGTMDRDSIIKQVLNEVERAIREGLNESNWSGLPASKDLAGNRH